MLRFGLLIGLLLTGSQGFHSLARAQDNSRFVSFDSSIESIRTLDQNWSAEESNWFYNAPQGSRLVPYAWFLHLEQPQSRERFLTAEHMRKLGFIARLPTPENPDALPVGFVKDASYDDGTEGVGLTCAACHTGVITFQKTAYIIDGGPTMGDVESLLIQIAQSLEQTASDDQKFERFSAKVLEGDNDSQKKQNLRETLSLLAKERSDYNRRNLSNGQRPRFGHGRIDAFGAIFNEVSATFLGIKDNVSPANAPVSFPCLWDAPQHDRVQWNGAAENRRSILGVALFGTEEVGALGRNTGEVLGVFGTALVNDHELLLPRRYDATANKNNLLGIESSLKRLWSPEWPEGLGQLDQARVARGESLFQDNCQDCHVRIDRDDPGRTVTAVLMDVQTDQTMLKNFGRSVKTGKLAGRRKTLFKPGRFSDKEPVPVILKHVVERVMLDPLTLKELKAALERSIPDIESVNPGFKTTAVIKYRDRTATVSLDALQSTNDSLKVFASPEVLQSLRTQLGLEEEEDGMLEIPNASAQVGYKARPLNGIWATAPYLHNGSVPTLAELLKPATGRKSSFHVGSTEYDPVNVGFIDDDAFPIFDTSLAGNGNSGHEFGVALTPEQKLDLLEFLKSL